MKLSDLIVTANRNLFRNKLRTTLTVLAIFVGAFTLTITNAIGDSLSDYIEKQVKNYEGTQVLFVHKKETLEDQGARRGAMEYTEDAPATEEIDPATRFVTFSQIEKLAGEFPEVVDFTPSYPVHSEYVTLDGEKKYVSMVNAMAKGMTRKIETGQQVTGEGQIILQYGVAKAMTDDLESLIGKEVTVGYKAGNPRRMQTEKLKIVGVSTKGMMESRFSSIDQATEKKIYEAQQKDSDDYDKFYSFSLQLNNADPKKIDAVKKALAEKGFEAETYADQNKRIYDAIGIFQLGMNLFAFISLLAASFGIINTLVIAVLERTKEIGLQKSLGMSRARIFFLFTLESVLIGFWGAVLGIGAAVVVGSISNSVASKYYNESFEGYSFLLFSPVSMILVALLICGIAFVSGVLPAFRASRLDPIEALRYE